MTVIGTITDEASLAAFDTLWSQKIKQPRGTKTTYQYSFDLRTRRGSKYSSRRWVYNANGMTKLMVIPDILQMTRVHRVPSAAELNRLVSITEG